MTSFLRQFDVTFTCEGPVFIGSGEKRTSKEYVQGAESVYFPDMERLYALVRAQGRASNFELFILNTGAGQGASRLTDWLPRNNIPISPKDMGGYWVRLGPLTAGRVRHLRGGRTTGGEQAKLNDIHMFIKDAFGQPYIPGSSVKGLLRSLFLQWHMYPRPQRATAPQTPATAALPSSPASLPAPCPQQAQSQDPVRFPVPERRDEQTRVGVTEEAKRLRRAARPDTRSDDAVNDLFQAIRVSDSMPLLLANLEITQKVDMNSEGEPAGLPLFREALKPGTQFTIRVAVDTSERQRGGFPEGANFILNLTNVAKHINAQRFAPYATKFFGGDPLEGAYVYLGGGAGYRSKTFVTHQDDMAKVLDSQFRQIQHREKTRQLGVSPLTLKVAPSGDNHFEEMGRCSVSVTEV